MKAVMIICGLLAGGLTIALGQKGVVASVVPTNPIVIDGDVSEWPADWLLDTKGKFAYNICNDNDNLYIRLKVSDDMTQRKIGLFGFTVYLNPAGKKQGKYGLRFPVAKDMDELKKTAPTGKVTKNEQEDLKMDLVRNEEVLELVGLSKETIVSSRLGLMNGIEVTIKPEDRNYVYEAKIPFKAYSIDKSKVKILGVSFVTGRMAVKPVANNNAPPPGGGPGNMGYGSRAYQQRYGGGGQLYGRSMMGGTQWSEWNNYTSMNISVKLK